MNESALNLTNSNSNATIDYETEDFPNTIWYNKGTKDLFTKLGIFIPLCILGLAGNLWVIYVLKSNKHIRTPSNLILGNMAVADMLSIIIYPSFIFVYDYFQNYELGPVGCKMEGPLECTILLASVISMSAITYDRLTAIVLPNDSKIDKAGAKVVIGLSWLIAMGLSAPLGFFRSYRERNWKNFDETYCVEDAIVVNIYWYVIITALVLLPLTIQMICYSAIFVKLSKYEKIIVKNFTHHQMGYKRNAAKMMFIVIMTFMICRLPYTAFIMYRHQVLKASASGVKSNVYIVKGAYHTLWFSSKYLLIANAAVNPLIYSVTNVSFRTAFRKTKLCRWIFSDSLPIIKTPNNKHKPPQSPRRRKNIFFIFRRYKSSDLRDSTTTKVEIVNTKF